MQTVDHRDPEEKCTSSELVSASPAHSKYEVGHSAKPTTLGQDTHSRTIDSLLGALFESS